jgi:hypothetical protein
MPALFRHLRPSLGCAVAPFDPCITINGDHGYVSHCENYEVIVGFFDATRITFIGDFQVDDIVRKSPSAGEIPSSFLI